MYYSILCTIYSSCQTLFTPLQVAGQNKGIIDKPIVMTIYAVYAAQLLRCSPHGIPPERSDGSGYQIERRHASHVLEHVIDLPLLINAALRETPPPSCSRAVAPVQIQTEATATGTYF